MERLNKSIKMLDEFKKLIQSIRAFNKDYPEMAFGIKSNNPSRS